MATEIILPHLGESIEEAVIAAWYKQVGDDVKRGDVLADVETAKATMPLECPRNGVVLAIVVGEGEEAKLGQLLAVVGKPGEVWVPDETPETPPAATPEVDSTSASLAAPTKAPSSDGETVRRRVSPGARNLAQGLGIDIDQVQPSKPGARITTEDVERYAASQGVGAESQDTQVPSHRIELNDVRKIVAKRMTESAQKHPQFHVSMRVNATRLIEGRKALNAKHETDTGKISLTAILVYLTAQALLEHPRLNARFDGDGLLVYDTINMVVAAATDDGLMVPIIHGVEALGIPEIAVKLRDLAAKARDGNLSLDEVTGGTFTISNLGMFGVSEFIPLIYPPQAAILGVGAALPAFLPGDKGEPVTAQIVNLTVSADHRVVDGADVSAFLSTLKNTIEAFTIQ